MSVTTLRRSSIVGALALASPITLRDCPQPPTGDDGGVPDAASDAGDTGAEEDAPFDAGGSTVVDADAASASAPSCATPGRGTSSCGEAADSCCTSLLVPGGTFDRTYTIADGGPAGLANLATVSSFRLDKYLVTVGRFRPFAAAVAGGWAPPAGSGVHAHVNGGAGLANSAAPGTFETGWSSAWNANLAPTDANLACDDVEATWAPTVGNGDNEALPINCVNWYEAQAFCIWDGGFLPSDAEWGFAAAGGAEQRQFPWGSTDPGLDYQHAVWDCDFPDDNARGSGFVRGIAPVGSAPLGVARWGQLDLAGELWEWNADFFAPYVDPCVDCAYLTPTATSVIRGGHFSYESEAQIAAYNRTSNVPTARDYAQGIRCAREP